MEPPCKPNKFRGIHTTIIFLSLFSMGMITAVTGCTMDDLGSIFGISVQSVSRTLVSKSAGALIGSLVSGGYLFDRMNAKVAIIATLIVGGIGVTLVPEVAPHFWIVHVVLFTWGLSVGMAEVGFNVWLIQLWEKDVNPILQTYHLSFGLGALVTPLITKPFLRRQNNSSSGLALPEFSSYIASFNATSDRASHIDVPYSIFGGMYSLAGVLFLIFFFIDRTTLRQRRAEEQENVSGYDATSRFEWIVVALLCTYLAINLSLESTMSQMLATYVERNPHLKMDKFDGANILALFWAMYTAGRLATIFISLRLKPNTILSAAQGIAVTGVGIWFILAIWPEQGRWPAWLGVAVIGAGLSSLYGTACTWAVRYIHLKFAHMSAVLMASCVGAAAPTYLVAPWVESSTTAMPIALLVLVILQVTILAVMFFTTRNREPIYEDRDTDCLVTLDAASDELSNRAFSIDQVTTR